jgi:hypothetical protein
MKNKILFENAHYVVCVTRAGLSVQNKRNWKGKLVPLASADFNAWVAAFDASIDNSESNALAKAIYLA